MPAYVISEVEIIDETAGAEYRRLAAQSIAEYGGRYLVRGADTHVAEGPVTTRKTVIVEFPSMERLQQWYASPSYAKALAYRDRALVRRLVFVEGLAGAV